MATIPKPRRTPKQGRSRATVNAILQAAARILAADGYDDLQTNRVVEVAGVGIGSLYEYFPNKDALVLGLADQFAATLQRELQEAHSSLDGLGLDDALARLVRTAFSVYERQPKLAAELLRRGPGLGADSPLDRIEVPIRMQLADLLSKHIGVVDVPSLDIASTVIVRSVRRLIDDAFAGSSSREVFPGHMAAEIEKEIVTMLRRYLMRR